MDMSRKLRMADAFFEQIVSCTKSCSGLVRPNCDFRFEDSESNIVLWIKWRGSFVSRLNLGEIKHFQLVIVQIFCCTLAEEKKFVLMEEEIQPGEKIVPKSIVTDVLSLVLLRLNDWPLLRENGFERFFITMESVLKQKYIQSLFRRGWKFQFNHTNDCMDLFLQSVCAMTKYEEFRALIPSAPQAISEEESMEAHMNDIFRIFRRTSIFRSAGNEDIARYLTMVTKVSHETALSFVASAAKENTYVSADKENDY